MQLQQYYSDKAAYIKHKLLLTEWIRFTRIVTNK